MFPIIFILITNKKSEDQTCIVWTPLTLATRSVFYPRTCFSSPLVQNTDTVKSIERHGHFTTHHLTLCAGPFHRMTQRPEHKHTAAAAKNTSLSEDEEEEEGAAEEEETGAAGGHREEMRWNDCAATKWTVQKLPSIMFLQEPSVQISAVCENLSPAWRKLKHWTEKGQKETAGRLQGDFQECTEKQNKKRKVFYSRIGLCGENRACEARSFDRRKFWVDVKKRRGAERRFWSSRLRRRRRALQRRCGETEQMENVTKS